MRQIYVTINPKRLVKQYLYGNSLRELAEVYDCSHTYLRNIIRKEYTSTHGWEAWLKLAYNKKHQMM